MREIKFRAWDKVIKVMRVALCVDLEKQEVICPPRGHEYSEWYNQHLSFNEVLVLQFTGLTDKNGKEIYEGDICLGGNLHLTGGFTLKNDHANIVRFVEGMFKLGSVSLVSFNKRTEVIGNIYENPELLGESK